VRVRIGGESRFIPVEYASRYRDALGTPLPPGLPEVFLAASDDPLHEIFRRYARRHGPFTTEEIAVRYKLQPAIIDEVLHALHGRGKLLLGEFRPRGQHQEWCDPEILQQIRRKSLARFRREVEPVEQRTFARFAVRWQGLTVRRRGLDALLDAIETLQGTALLASELEREILPARVADYRAGDLDTVMAAGEVVWVGLEQIGARDGRIALYLTESLPLLLPPTELETEKPPLSEKAQKILDFLARNGASFFSSIHAALGGGFPGETREALWELVWSGLITNDTLHPVRDLLRPPDTKRDRAAMAEGPPGSPEFLRRLRSRKSGGGPAQGRWSPIASHFASPISTTEWSANVAQQLLTRYGIVMRETAVAESIPRGYSAIYPALKAMEDSGWIRRGMFVAAMGAAQFAATSAVDMLRSVRTEPENAEVVFLAASDPANPYGWLLPWPRENEQEADAGRHGMHGMSRTSGAGVILINGALAAFFRRRNQSLRVFLPENEPERTKFARELAKKFADIAVRWRGRRSGLLIGKINEAPAREHFMANFLAEHGFIHSALGFQMRRVTRIMPTQESDQDHAAEERDEDISESP
jgi:ATP-dependent Lhr-like helicase